MNRPNGLHKSKERQPLADERQPNPMAGNTALLTLVIVVAVLYFARVVFLPLALAVLLAFLLAPLTMRLRSFGLGRVPSTIIVVLFSALIVAIISSVMASQLTDLTRKLPEYQENVRHKIESVRASGGGVIERATRLIANVTDGLMPRPAPPSKAEEKPVPVEIRRAPFAPLEMMQKVAGSVLNIVVMTGVVIVFVIFMLIQREDLRDRLLRLLGERRINVTTQALDDAAGRLSRYLLAQLIVNFAYGGAIGVGLYFAGVPNPLLWGILTALLRYIPYLGIWIAAAMPALLAFAVEPGWIKVPVIFGLYLGVDLLMYNFVEPPLYGTSTGISPMAILVAAVFWTWLWGPLGLLLATPLTVCVVVIGRYVPSLEFLSVMLSDEPVLTPEIRFYQRLLAMDLKEATEVAEQFLKGKSLEDVYDGVMIPALARAEEDRHAGKLDETRQEFILQSMRLLVEDLAKNADDVAAGVNSSRKRSDGREAAAAMETLTAGPASVVCLPARDEADEIAALMLAQLLRKRGVNAKNLSATAMGGERLESVGREKPQILCLTAVPPLGYMPARLLCRQLRTEFPEVKLTVAILTEEENGEIKQRLPTIKCDELVTSLKAALTAILSFVPERQSQPAQPALHAA